MFHFSHLPIDIIRTMFYSNIIPLIWMSMATLRVSPSSTSVRGTEGREEDANKASISRVGRPEGDSLLHPSSYCTRGNQGTSAQCSLLTSPGIFHNSGNCHQESQFLTYMTCLLALSKTKKHTIIAYEESPSRSRIWLYDLSFFGWLLMSLPSFYHMQLGWNFNMLESDLAALNWP